MNTPQSPSFQHGLRAGLAAACILTLAVPAQADWLQTTSGTYDFLTPGNWSDGSANGVLPSTLTLTGTQVITFSGDWTSGTAGLQLLYGGSNYAYPITLRGDGVVARTVTLNGDLTFDYGAAIGGTASIGSSTAAQALNLNLGGTTRTITVGGIAWATDLLKVYNTISNGGLVKTGAGTLQLSGSNSYAGDTSVKAGVVTLISNGVINSKNIYISTTGKYTGNDGESLSRLSIDNSSGSNTNRIADDAKIFLNSGVFVISNSNNTSLTETVGAMTLEGGANTLEVNRNGTGTVLMNIASLTRSNQSVLRVSGAGLGASGSSQIKVGNSTELINSMIGGGGADGTTNIKILPWVTGVTNGTRSARAASSFATYDETLGFRYLNSTTEYRQGLNATSTSSDATTDNVRVVGSETLTSDMTVNSLLFDVGASTYSIGGAYKLTISSGALYMKSGAAVTNSIKVSTLDFGGQEAIIGVASTVSSAPTLSITSVITNTGGKGLTKYGAGELQLSAGNTYTGDTVVDEGRLRSMGNAIPDASNLRVSLMGSFVVNGGAWEQVKSLAGTGLVYLDSNTARLNVGTGVMNGTGGRITVGEGGILSPGDPSGSQRAGMLSLGIAGSKVTDLQLLSGAELDIDISSMRLFDSIAVLDGSALLGGKLNLTYLDGYMPVDHDSFKIITTTGGVTGNFDSILVNGVAAVGYTTQVQGNDLYLIYSAVPEPSTYAMLVGGVGLLIGAQRMRRRNGGIELP